MGARRTAAMVTIKMNWHIKTHPRKPSSLVYPMIMPQHVQQDMQIAIQARTSAAMMLPRKLPPTISEGLFTDFIAL
jgi:hypothetical protein